MKKLLFIFAILLFLPGCQKEDTILNTPIDPLHKEFSISGSADGITTYPFGNSAPYRHFEGEGQSSPGGDIRIILDYLITSFTPPNGTSGFCTGELITQNGDKIYAINGAGTFSVSGTTVTFNATGDLAGGTGEFDNVKGTITYTGTLDQLTGETHAEWTGTFTREKPIEGTLWAENTTAAGSCGPGYTRRHAEGGGSASHFGNVILSMEHCVNFTTGILTEGNGTLEVANGDKIFTTHNGYMLPVPGTNTVTFSMFITIIGGVGRFEGAEGFLWVKGTQVLPEGTAECTFDGVIDY
jgi:hypothetical protein